MIKEINIKNFQSHRDTKMSLHPGLNVIVGTSYSGKSAILRALRWLVENKAPKGTYRSFWGGDTSIELVLDDHSATRGRTDKENTYALDGEILKAFKADVPDPVRNLLNFNEINLQKQHDMPFLVSKSGPEIQRSLNEVANLDLIDTTMTNLNGSKLKTSAEINDINEKLNTYEIKITALEAVELIKEKSVKLKELNNYTQAEKKRYESLLDVISSTKNYKDQIEYKLKQAECYRNLQAIVGHINTQKGKENTLEAIIGTIESINSVNLRLTEAVKSQEKYKNLKILEKQALDIRIKKTDVVSKKSVLEGIKYTAEQIKELKEDIPNLERVLFDYQISIKELIGDMCPVCGTRKGEVRV
ncbi:MAG: AAA family ATPase [Methanogenium sp.]|jgi:exonuclease SbcC